MGRVVDRMPMFRVASVSAGRPRVVNMFLWPRRLDVLLVGHGSFLHQKTGRWRVVIGVVRTDIGNCDGGGHREAGYVRKHRVTQSLPRRCPGDSFELRSWPRVASKLSSSCRTVVPCAEFRLNFGHRWSMLANASPMLARFGPESANSAPTCSMLAAFGQHWPTLVNICKHGPTGANTGQQFG